MAKTFLQVRTDERDKEQASVILEQLGTNLSSVVNMLLKQIIMTKSIPFEVRMSKDYTEKEKTEEVKASMEMEMSDTIYCYPDSDVLMNKMDIRDQAKLEEAERRLTMFRMSDLLDTPVKGDFDLKHLQSIHRYLFQDLYSWAGQIRTVDISKAAVFCKARFIEEQAHVLFGKLKDENCLLGISKDRFIRRIAYYFSEINALHPFREGNGRTQREFVRELALKRGYVIRFARISRDEMMEASRESFLCRYEKMEEVFWRAIQ